ncbi:MAG: hypothetical protein ACLFTH_00125 [Candidatus Woesearchaeota archaeon]
MRIYDSKKGFDPSMIAKIVFVLVVIFLGISLLTDKFSFADTQFDSTNEKLNKSLTQGNIDPFLNEDTCDDQEQGYFKLKNTEQLASFLKNQHSGKVKIIHEEDVLAIKKYLDEDEELEFPHDEVLNYYLKDDVTKGDFCPDEEECTYASFEETFIDEALCKGKS